MKARPARSLALLFAVAGAQAAAVSATPDSASASAEPAPFGLVPSERQLEWHAMETFGMVHFGFNATTGKEWGFGDEDPKSFDPAEFNADQIAAGFKSAGFKGVVFVAKHHDGFCLWPTKSTPHNIANSPYKGGKGDIVREMADACRRAGLKFGLYVSPWDRNHHEYGKPGYIPVYHEQIRELLTRYGELYEFWFDGFNAKTGWYGGAKGVRPIDERTYYQWPVIEKMIRTLQPKAVVFGSPFGDVRWNGNEKGLLPAGSRPIVRSADTYGVEKVSSLQQGNGDGDKWAPAECDVSIRSSWFWKASQDNFVKTPAKLLDIYFRSVGNGGGLLLNVPPTNTGAVHPNDLKSLAGFGEVYRRIFSRNLADGARIEASSVRKNDAAFGPAKLLDDDKDSYWSPEEGVTDASVTLTLREPSTFNIIRLREALKLGLRAENWAVDVFENNAWREYTKGAVIGNNRLLRGYPVTTDRIRVRLSGGKVAPALSEVALFAEPIELATVEFSRDKAGRVSLTGGNTIRYTLDGSEPEIASPLASAPFTLPKGGLVKAAVFDRAGAHGDIAAYRFGLPKSSWTLVSPASDASAVIDDDPKSLWTAPKRKDARPSLTIDLGKTETIAALRLTPRADGKSWGLIDNYRFETSPDGVAWSTASEGEISNVKSNPVPETISLKTPVQTRFVRLTVLHCLDGASATLGEIDLLSRE